LRGPKLPSKKKKKKKKLHLLDGDFQDDERGRWRDKETFTSHPDGEPDCRSTTKEPFLFPSLICFVASNRPFFFLSLILLFSSLLTVAASREIEVFALGFS